MRLSIITINYNNKDGLQKTMDSVVRQTWKDFEWIIIDGGSTDGSKELIVRNQQYVDYWCSEPDKGVYNAMNKGISKAQGDYLLFLNSGDCLHNAMTIEDVLKYEFKEDVVYGNLNYVAKDKEYVVRYPSDLTIHYFLVHSLGHPASFIKASLLKTDGYREDYKIVSDWINFLKWFREGRSFLRIENVIADFDTTGISSSNIDLIEQEKESVFGELFGKENRKLIEESIMLQNKNEEMMNIGLLPLRAQGGKRWTLLLYFINFLNATLKWQRVGKQQK